MCRYPTIHPAGIALAALGLLALAASHVHAGFQTSLSFDAGFTPVSVAAGDFNGDGKLDLAVTDAANSSLSVLLGRGDGTFQPPVSYTVGHVPTCVVVADFHGDGKLDLATTNYSSRNVTVLLGNGDGSFQPARNYAVEKGPLNLAVGDFNGDGTLDLAVVNQTAGTVSVLLGNGDGSFQAAVNLAAGASPNSVAVGDFNGDGHADLVVANYLAQGTVSVLLGNGDGSFQAPRSYDTGNGPSTVAVGDFNGDGHLDLAVALKNVGANGNMVAILLGNGDGSFRAANTYAVAANPWYVVVADFNDDGILDVAVNSLGPNGQGSVNLLLGKGDGSFQTAKTYAVGWTQDPLSLSPANNTFTVGDFNGDGKLDLAVVNSLGNNVSVLLGKGDGTFPVTPNYSTGSYPLGGVARADFNGDGIPDLAVTNTEGTVSILLGKGGGTFQPAVNYPTGPGSVGIAVADLNGDGFPDLAVADENEGSVAILLGNGDGTFYAGEKFPAGLFPTGIVAADFNHDGVPDLAVTSQGRNPSTSRLTVLLGNGNGTFQTAQEYAINPQPIGIAVGDFNGDGVPDLATADLNRTSVSIFLGNGDGTFQAAVEYLVHGAASLVVGDLNGDGKLDIAVARGTGIEDDSSLSVLLGNGDGTFQAPVEYAVGPVKGGGSPEYLAMDDIDGDGTADLVVVFGGGVRVLFGNGDGTFRTTPVTYLAGLGPIAVTVGDLNGDGLPDLAVANYEPNGGVTILINDGIWTP